MNLIRKYKSIIMMLGLASIVIGYFLLANNSISLAPVLLVLGYCVLVPISLL